MKWAICYSKMSACNYVQNQLPFLENSGLYWDIITKILLSNIIYKKEKGIDS